MPGSHFKFGGFLLDETAYRLFHLGIDVALTPKVLDLLIYLAEHAGALVTKEQLLDALWPDANVTENALAQAMSELREALNDNASDPKYIKTIARRGYRFIGAIERVEAPPTVVHAPAAPQGAEDIPAIAVMDFANVTGDEAAAWLSAGIAETVAGDLRVLGRFRVVDRERVLAAMRRTDGSLQQVTTDLGAPLAVLGNFQLSARRIRITARIVNVGSGEAIADAKVDGPFEEIFALQDDVVAQFSKDLGLAGSHPVKRARSRETASLEAYRAFVEGWLQLETLDVAEISRAARSFERAIEIDAQYAHAFTGLANAELAAYEATRWQLRPEAERLARAIVHARKAVELDDTLAESHATLAFVLVSDWNTPEALIAARKAVGLEPMNWRHFFRLGHASWGGERLRAASATLSLYPDFSFAHYQVAMVHVARGHLTEAETVLRQGAAVQDRQIGRGDRYPGLGLHWLLALVRLAQGDPDEAIREARREAELAEPHRLYGSEYAVNAAYVEGASLLRSTRLDASIGAFARALELYPDHSQSHLGLALAYRAKGMRSEMQEELDSVAALLSTLTTTRPLEAALVQTQLLAARGQPAEALSGLRTMLETAPPGFAGWTLPVEPLLSELLQTQGATGVLSTLYTRAN